MAEAVLTEGRGRLFIQRIFAASRDRVWKAWTDPDLIAQWWGPAGFTAPVIEVDLRKGGRYLFSMRSPVGQEFWSTGVYREIVPMERLVYTDSFADAEGNVVPASTYGMSSTNSQGSSGTGPLLLWASKRKGSRDLTPGSPGLQGWAREGCLMAGVERVTLWSIS